MKLGQPSGTPPMHAPTAGRVESWECSEGRAFCVREDRESNTEHGHACSGHRHNRLAGGKAKGLYEQSV